MITRISVLMGIYNCADTLPEALDSLYAQTYQGFKIILCDDASTDDTYKVAKNYADKYDNIVLIRNEKNLKLAATLNHCLEYVDTEYIARMDGDDISLPTRFEKEIEFLDNNPDFALVSCPMIHFDKTGDWGIGKAIEKPNKNHFKTAVPFAHAACMIRTDVMLAVGGYTVSNLLQRGQDYYLWYKIYKAGYKGFNLNEPLYKMRDDRDAIARRKFKNRFKGAVIRYRVLKGLNASSPLYYATLGAMKAFVPRILMERIRKKRMGINKNV
ncbi:glycosyltransferase EpsE [Winogradskyella epiphytica]|uniref:Glycosyltransferase EpsE n=1 Tax=Winogradskyella epiphytica TaxID=262005 RepID=A0A2V4Y1L0_9FLAO|nr:glycosyltransferase [Winogradskyella epiphytica]PYE82704.1 glycosyltransferase EpsE [Winogradskyella epiphytica]GGW53083.1 putative glycosyltransferase EpsE [Winogradskyella epiphytica]